MRLDELHAILPRAERIHGGKFRARCPGHDGSSASLAVAQGRDGRLLLKCFAGCSTEEVLDALGLTARDLFDTQAPPMVRTPRAAPLRAPEPDDDARRKAHQAETLWSAAQYLTSGPAVEYLLARGCVIPPSDGDLRWHREVSLFGFAGPALLGRISSALDASTMLGLHVTWLRREEGRWRRGERRYLGRKAGGVIRLWPDDAVDAGLGIAEGVETALAAAHAFRPVWACMDAGNLEAFPVLPGIEALTVFADNDESGRGQQAADLVAERWAQADRDVRVYLPRTVGQDVADEVLG